MSRVAEFITRYPSVKGYTLICVCEEINRITKAGVGVDGILERALRLDHAAQYLVRVCDRFQSQENIG
jgi:hypothetical protein